MQCLREPVNAYASQQIRTHWGLTLVHGVCVCCKLIPPFLIRNCQCMLLSAHSLHAQFTNDDVTQRRAFFAPTPRTHFHLKSVLTHSLCSLNITVYIMCGAWCLQSRSLATSDFDCKSTSSKCTLSYTAVKTSKFTAFLPLLCTVKHFMQWVHYKNPVNVPYLAANQIVALSVQLIDFSLSTIKKSTKKILSTIETIFDKTS